MKGRKYKRSQRFMTSVYEKAFGLRTPYQLILDGEFLEETLAKKILFRDLLPTVLGGNVKLFTTACVIHELQLKKSPAIFNAKRLEIRRCPHTNNHRPGEECIREIIGDQNAHHYGVCAQQWSLREALRLVPGVPLLFVNRGILLMEDPSEVTVAKAQELSGAKLKPSDAELKFINSVVPVIKPLEPAKKKKKKGGPNPLSVKKKSVKTEPASKPTLAEGASVAKKKTRRHRK